MHHCLVIGMDGTIGSALYSRLKLAGRSVWGTTYRQKNDHKNHIIHLNLKDPPESWNLPDVAFDVVYVCAGICKMAVCEQDPATANQVNIVGTLELVRRLSNSGAFIVYLSTNQVFSGQEPFSLPTADYQPMNEYGRQKSKAEQLIKTDCLNWAIVRLTKVIEFNMPLLQIWYNRLICHQQIDAFRDMMLAPVMLRQVIDVLMMVGNKKQKGCYQVSGAIDTSYYDFANAVADRLECPRSLVQSVSAIDKGMQENFLPKHTTLDCSTTMALGGEKPPHYLDVINEYFCFSNVEKEK